MLLDYGADPDAKGVGGDRSLHHFCRNGDLEYVQLLVERGARIDSLNDNNETPFFIANRENREEICLYLLEKRREAENRNPEETYSNKAPCIICRQPRNALYVLNPCGHTSLCEMCSYEITKQRYSKCPYCRKPVSSYTKLYFQAATEE